VTLTTPSVATVTVSAFCGMVIAGCTGIAAGGDDLPLVVLLERPVARVGGRPVGQQHLEEARAVDRHVETVAGLLQRALREDATRGHRRRAQADLQTIGNLRRLRRLRSRLAQGLIEQVGENAARLLEAVGADVRQVVGNDVDLHLLRVEAGTGGPERADHRFRSISGSS
jgi:hypothetical protein